MVDYSKWKTIEVSDDEDDTHPNIDTPSLFRWRHQARVERMETHQKEKDALKRKRQNFDKKWLEFEKSETKTDDERQKLEEERKKLEEEEKEMEKKEKKMAWNVDTISKEGFAKTVINTEKPASFTTSTADVSDEKFQKTSRNFMNAHEDEIKKFGMLQRYEDSKRFLMDHQHLVCEHTTDFLIFWCLELAMEEKFSLMEHVSHQVVCMQYIMELAKTLKVDPRACVGRFFDKLPDADAKYKEVFQTDIAEFRERIRKRAKEKLAELIAKEEEEERAKRLGPGGLDPVEVFESLPAELKLCFETMDKPLLERTIKDMPADEAAYHMRRCIDSGLWIPDANDSANHGGGQMASRSSKDVNDDAAADGEKVRGERQTAEVKEHGACAQGQGQETDAAKAAGGSS